VLGSTRVWISRATASSFSIRSFSTRSSSKRTRWIATAQLAASAVATPTSGGPNGPDRLLSTWRTPTRASSWPTSGTVRIERVLYPVALSTSGLKRGSEYASGTRTVERVRTHSPANPRVAGMRSAPAPVATCETSTSSSAS